jgi:hypothetical protein
VIKNLERYNIDYVYQDKESSRKSGMKDIHVIKINDLQFKIKRSTKMKKIFDAFCEKYGIDVNNISFYLDDMKLNENDTLNSLGIENEDELEIYTRSISSKRSSRKRSSRKRSSRSSPKRFSSKRSSSKRSSSKRSSTKRSSPKINNRISTTIDGKKYKKKISPKRFISFNK